MMLSVAFALLAAIPGLVSGVAAVSVPSPVEKYEFVCAPGETVDSFANFGALASFGAIVPVNSDVLVCSAIGIGVHTTLVGSTTSNVAELPILTSENSVAGLKNHFVEKQQASGIAIEVFVTLPTNDDSDHMAWGPIVTVGKASLGDAIESGSDKCFVWNNFLGGIDWQLFLHGDQVQVLSEEKFTCPRASFSDMPRNSPTTLAHFVWSQSESETQLFVNGEKVSHNPDSRFDTTLGVWNDDYAVHVLSEWAQIDAYPGVSPHFFSGTIHSLSIYDEPLNESQVHLAYQSGRDYFLDVIGNNLQGKMVATPWNNVTLEQDDTASGVLSIGADSLVMDDSIVYIIEVLSEPDDGYLTLLDGITPVKSGTLLELPAGETRTSLRYWSYTEDSFTVPSKSANGWPLKLSPPDSFDFRLVAFYSESNEVLLVSSTATQLVNIRNVNRPPLWEDVPTVIKQDQVSIGNDDSALSTLISGGKLSDPDLNVLFVRVTVTGVNGTVTLNSLYLNLAISCKSSIGRSWQCTGKDNMGSPNTKITFFAEPDDVELILSDLTFTAFVLDTPGGIYLDAYDGINLNDGESGECISANDYVALANKGVPSVSRGCYNAHASITLEPGEIVPESPSGLEKKLLGISYAAWIRYVTYAALACCVFTTVRCCFSCVFGRRGRSGAEIDIEEGPDY